MQVQEKKKKRKKIKKKIKKIRCSSTQCVVKLYSSLIQDVGVLKVKRHLEKLYGKQKGLFNSKIWPLFQDVTEMSIVGGWENIVKNYHNLLAFLANYTVICSWHLHFATAGRGIIREMNLWADPLKKVVHFFGSILFILNKK